jgi:uncharacterized membrane protein YedE/YeeE
MTAVNYAVSLLLAGLLGFAVHRSGLCNVRTVAEIISTHRAYMMASGLKAVLWVMAVSLPILLFFPTIAAPVRGYAITFAAILGGFLFGVGAAINGGCAFSTLGHLANGNLWMFLTLLGFCIGVSGLSIAAPTAGPSQVIPPLLLETPSPLILAILVLLWLLGFYEISRLWRSRAKGRGLKHQLFSKYYRLSTAALILGCSGGLLYVLHDSWNYTNVLKQQIRSLWHVAEQPMAINLFLFLALFLGMCISAFQRGSMRLRWKRVQIWPRHLIGGVLMGTGAVLIPGGNDTLLLKSLPGLSPHAIPSYAALLIGVAVTLPSLRYLTGDSFKVICTGDICREENVKRINP